MALPISCPIPSNINPLQSNGFRFNITKLPEVDFFCQEVNLPGISLPSPEIDTPFSRAPFPGDKLDFDDLQVTFLIDENMVNYMAVHTWMVALGFPKMYEQYTSYMALDTVSKYSELARNYSDGVLQILNSSNNPVKTFQFRDLVPTGLQSVVLASTTTDTQYLAGTATFKYTYYEILQ